VITITVITFAVQQAARRAVWEARDRRVANEMTAYPAFVAGIPESPESSILKDIALRYFPGTSTEIDDPKPSAGSSSPSRWGFEASVIGSVLGTVVLGIALVYSLTR
jgi:hypothetical protein